MISLLYCGNDKVFRGLLISLLSVASHTREALDVHLLTMDLTDRNPAFRPITEEQSIFLEKILHEKHPESRIARYDIRELFLSEMKDSPNLDSVYTPYTLLRLFSDLLPLPERVLYLDTDTAAIGDVRPLFEYDMKDCEYAGALDYLGKVFINPRYINAGVLLLDLEKIRQTGFFKKARGLVAEKKLPFPDQDAGNRLAKKKCFLPRGYNEQRRMRKDTVIRHFSKSIRWLPFYHTVNVKPWEIDRLHTIYHTYEFDDVLAEYQTKMQDWELSQSCSENPR